MNKAKKIAMFFLVGAFVFFSLSFYSFYQVNSLVINSIDIVHNSYIENYDISNTEIDKLDETLDRVEKQIVSNEVALIINNQGYNYSLYELGIGINKDKLKNEIINYENELDYWKLYNNYSKNSFNEKKYEYEYVIDEEKLDEFLKKVKKRLDITPKRGELSMNSDRNLEFVGEVIGFSADIEKTKEIIKSNFSSTNYNKKIIIEGENIYLENPNKVIDTKISSFTTTFDDTVMRKYNLIAGAKRLDGKIIEPHQVFSFFENVGPYSIGNGFVFYSGILGNGVCQVATTLYNAELLAGLTTVERYNHGIKSVYVDGGLDATVAVTKGYVTDFKFKNTYDYPVYISAFVKGDKLTIELWSSKDAKGGKEYKTESVKHGYGAYQSYRHTYKDNQLIKTENLGMSYYFKE